MFARPQPRRVEVGPEFLDPDQRCDRAEEFEAKLASSVVGQDRAVRAISSLYRIFLVGLNQPDRPIGTMLLLGPTGSGKTHIVEKTAEALFGTKRGPMSMIQSAF